MSSDTKSVLPQNLGTPFYAGSVQSLYQLADFPEWIVAETGSGGSVFDVGTIFDIPGSAEARALFRHVFFTRLASVGAKTHHVGMVDAVTGEVVRDGVPENRSNRNVIERFDIRHPEPSSSRWGLLYDYSQFTGADNYVVPLELLVRFGMTSASSVFKKYQKLSPDAKVAYAQDLAGVDTLEPWGMLPDPIVDCTSKFEPSDRMVTRQEALLMSGLSAEKFCEVLGLAIKSASELKALFGEMGLELWDLKWEFGVRGGDLLLVDTIDTDSVRATLRRPAGERTVAVHINKQAMRDYYAIAHSDWLSGVNRAKAEADTAGRPFQEILVEGQETGRFLSTPEVDPDFLALQCAKSEAVTDHLLGKSGNAAEKLTEIADREIDYYRSHGWLDQLIERNATD